MLQERLRPGEGKMNGILSAIDAVGYEAFNDRDPSSDNKNNLHQKPMQVLDHIVELLDYTGHIGIIGVYFPSDPGGVDQFAKLGKFLFPLGQVFEKGLTIGTGQTPVKRYIPFLRDLIISGRAKPSFIITKEISIDEASDAYQNFDERRNGYLKVLIHFT